MAVYLDMDPGHDDALALFLAMSCLPVRGLSVVAGNQTVDLTYRNACRLVQMGGWSDFPVAKGSARPIFVPLFVADYVHGETGLDGFTFPFADDASSAPRDAACWLPQVIGHESEPIDWIATGPLTNVARLLIGHPHLKSRIRSLTIMGGALGVGNVTPYAEFNLYVDPDAAAYVFEAGLPLTMVGLDVTHRVLLSPAHIERFKTWDTAVGEMFYGLFSYFQHHEPNATSHGVPIHDALAVAAVARPDLFAWKDAPLVVERCGERRGQTQKCDRGAMVRVAVDVQVAEFFEWFWQQLEAVKGTNRLI